MNICETNFSKRSRHLGAGWRVHQQQTAFRSVSDQKMLDAYPVDVDARDSFSDLGQSFTSRTADEWADCANSEDWGSPPSPCGGTLQEEKTAGPDGLVADGTPNLPPQFPAPGDHQLSPAQALSATSTGGYVTLSA